MKSVAFRKMHGLGNDFVVLDGRRETIAIDATAARALADRHTGVGCDQLIVIEPPSAPAAHVAMRIVNADGSEAEACGNGTRCVAWLVSQEAGHSRVRIETAGGLLESDLLPSGLVAVDMGMPRVEWQEIPLARRMDTAAVKLSLGPLSRPVCTNIGNPHATFFVDDAEAIDLASLGPPLEHDPLFPERANIGVATVVEPRRIRLRVWERGVGITRACGSAACAALVAGYRRRLVGPSATIQLDGGELEVELREDDLHVIMTGPATLAFEGSFDASLLGP